jgi:hypothetical protein
MKNSLQFVYIAPLKIAITFHVMSPKAAPLKRLKVKGTMNMVVKHGNASVMTSHLIFFAFCIISTPTINNIGIVPVDGISANNGLKKQQIMKQNPQTTVDKPVFAPSLIATPDSGDIIIGGPEFKPLMIVQNPHTRNKNRPLGIVSSLLVNPDISLSALDNPIRAREHKQKTPNISPYVAGRKVSRMRKSLSVFGKATIESAAGQLFVLTQYIKVPHISPHMKAP